MRIVTHLDVYIPHGLDPDVIKLLKGELGIMKSEALRCLWLCWGNALRSEWGRRGLAVRKGVE